jgi:hypothetical protein
MPIANAERDRPPSTVHVRVRHRVQPAALEIEAQSDAADAAQLRLPLCRDIWASNRLSNDLPVSNRVKHAPLPKVRSTPQCGRQTITL